MMGWPPDALCSGQFKSHGCVQPSVRCALNKSVLMNAAVASDTLRLSSASAFFFLDAVATGLALFLFNCTSITADVLPKWRELRNPSFFLIQELLSRWLSTRRNRTSS